MSEHNQILSNKIEEMKLEIERVEKSSQEIHKEESEQEKQNFAVSELQKIVDMIKAFIIFYLQKI